MKAIYFWLYILISVTLRDEASEEGGFFTYMAEPATKTIVAMSINAAPFSNFILCGAEGIGYKVKWLIIRYRQIIIAQQISRLRC
jgi:hypothetical protein